jgi:hypothetical protein
VPWRWRLRAVAVAALIALLPLAHNLWYGGRFVLLTDAGAIPANLLVSPGQIWAATHDATARSVLLGHLRLVAVYEGTAYLQGVAHGLQIVWLIAVAMVLRRRSIRGGTAVLLTVPLLFLAVHLFYQVAVYYPRHVVAGHASMALVALTVVRGVGSARGRA